MEVTVYTTPTCGFCKQVKSFLGANNVDFSEVDVSNDQKAADAMIEKSGQMGVPVVFVKKDGKEEMIIGFNESKLKEALGL